MKPNKKKISIIVFSVLYSALLIFMAYQSLSSADDSTIQSGTIVSLLSQLKIFEPLVKNGTIGDFVRKVIGHFSEFGILGIFGYLLFINAFDNKYSLLIGSGVGLLSSAIIELLQFFGDGRAPSYFDIILDFEGYLTAFSSLTIVFLIIHLLKKESNIFLISNYFITLPAYVLGAISFAFYRGGSIGIMTAHLIYSIALIICLAFALILLLINKKSAKIAEK